MATLKQIMGQVYAVKWGAIDETWTSFVNSGRKGHFVYGHLRDRHLVDLEQSDMDYRLFTFLRDPVDRLISVYRYNASPASPNYNQFVKRWPDFESWAVWYSETFPNDIASFTVGEVGSVDEYVGKLVSRFGFIGFQETYSESVYVLGELLGIELTDDRRENVTLETEHNDIEVPDSLRDRLRELNRLDCEAYLKVKKLFYVD